MGYLQGKMTPCSGLVRINSIQQEDLLVFSALPPLVDPSGNIDDDDDFKSTNMFKDPTLLINNNQHQIPIKSENYSSNEFPINNNYIATNQGNQVGIQNMFSDFYFMHGGNNSSYSISGLDNKHCNNMEQQFSTNQSMVVSVSQDTCLSNDRNNDTSSVVSLLDN